MLACNLLFSRGKQSTAQAATMRQSDSRSAQARPRTVERSAQRQSAGRHGLAAADVTALGLVLTLVGALVLRLGPEAYMVRRAGLQSD